MPFLASYFGHQLLYHHGQPAVMAAVADYQRSATAMTAGADAVIIHFAVQVFFPSGV